MIKLRIAALANARKPGFSAFIFSSVKTPTGNSADYKQEAADGLGQMGLFYGKPTGRNSERTAMAVVAEANDDADRWLRSTVGGRPLAGSVMQVAGHFGAITLRDGSVKAKGPRSSSSRSTAMRMACLPSSSQSCYSTSPRVMSG